jgi:hypothetical protein
MSEAALSRLLKARALTMLGKFQESQDMFAELEKNPGLVNDDWKLQLTTWADQARRYPGLLQITGMPDARDRLDLARILAVSGAKPDRWLFLFVTEGPMANRLGKNIVPGDYVLQAMGHAQMAAKLKGQFAINSRAKAVECLASAFEAGYLNRARIKNDNVLVALTSDPAVARYFVTQ